VAESTWCATPRTRTALVEQVRHELPHAAGVVALDARPALDPDADRDRRHLLGEERLGQLAPAQVGVGERDHAAGDPAPDEVEHERRGVVRAEGLVGDREERDAAVGQRRGDALHDAELVLGNVRHQGHDRLSGGCAHHRPPSLGRRGV